MRPLKTVLSEAAACREAMKKRMPGTSTTVVMAGQPTGSSACSSAAVGTTTRRRGPFCKIK